MTYRPAPDDLAPQALDHARALPAAFYTDPSTLSAEERLIFARHWQLVAHVSQLSGTGDHVVTQIAGTPLIIVRGEDGTLRAMHNVCRHRAGPLAYCDGRGARALRCHYHGWTYTLDGRLRSATEMADTKDFDVSAIRLSEARVATWHGLVFAALDPVIELDALLAGIEPRLAKRDLGAYAFDRRLNYEVACNWKVYVENYLEGYHVPHIHPELNKLLDYRNYITEARDWHALQYSPMEGTGNFYGDGEALYYWLWPNLMLNLLPDRLQINRVVPIGVDRCRVEFDYLYPVSTKPDEEARRIEDRRFSEVVQHEDGDICEVVQRNLASGRYQPGRLNPKRENALHHFQEMIRTIWRGE